MSQFTQKDLFSILFIYFNYNDKIYVDVSLNYWSKNRFQRAGAKNIYQLNAHFYPIASHIMIEKQTSIIIIIIIKFDSPLHLIEQNVSKWL